MVVLSPSFFDIPLFRSPWRYRFCDDCHIACTFFSAQDSPSVGATFLKKYTETDHASKVHASFPCAVRVALAPRGARATPGFRIRSASQRYNTLDSEESRVLKGTLSAFGIPCHETAGFFGFVPTCNSITYSNITVYLEFADTSKKTISKEV